MCSVFVFFLCPKKCQEIFIWEKCKSDFRFMIGDPKILRTLIFTEIKTFSDLFPLYWIRHFEFCKIDFKFVISDLERFGIPNRMQIRSSLPKISQI